MESQNIRIKKLFAYIELENRLVPLQWTDFYKILVGDLENYSGIGDPPIPLILGGFYSPHEKKRNHFFEQIEYGIKNGKLDEMENHIYGLGEDGWLYSSETDNN
jgi:hypothetical protein